MTPDIGKIVITGDVTMDWNFAGGVGLNRLGGVWKGDDFTRVHWQRGGAAMLADLMSDVVRCEGLPWQVIKPPAPDKAVRTSDRKYHHSYAMWSRQDYSLDLSTAKDPVWRVDEFLGLDRATEDPDDGSDSAIGDDGASVIVLNDANLGFRDRPARWPKCIVNKPSDSGPWILIKMAHEVARGPLWESILKHRRRLIVAITANNLRLADVRISRGLSWESTVEDLISEIRSGRLKDLAECAYVVISFGTAGAVLLSHPGGPEESTYTLLFDPTVIEGEWEGRHAGGMISYTVCLAAALARELMRHFEGPNIEEAVQSGLSAMRRLHLDGYVQDSNDGNRLVFPHRAIGGELKQPTWSFSSIVVKPSGAGLRENYGLNEPASRGQEPADPWTILGDIYHDSAKSVAEQVVICGTDVALRGAPTCRFGDLVAVDRLEIESFRSVASLINKYCGDSSQAKPLSIAVFGEPGSGKSFGIKQIARSVLPSRIEVLEFNMAQFVNPEAMLGALHQVRDVGLSTKVPLVFWDEFDTRLNGEELGWLRHFLAPMQDGRFQEGQVSHRVGRCIFAFAGGVHSSLDSFSREVTKDALRNAKGPDFLSRLKGFVDIAGPNSVLRADRGPDACACIRRAVLLRTILRRDAPNLFKEAISDGKKFEKLDIDKGVLGALLYVEQYKHGVRSIESIIAMSLLQGRRRFERSCLPPLDQLRLHVEPARFQRLIHDSDPATEARC